MYNNFEISLVLLMPNITTNHPITCTNEIFLHNWGNYLKKKQVCDQDVETFLLRLEEMKDSNYSLAFAQCQ